MTFYVEEAIVSYGSDTGRGRNYQPDGQCCGTGQFFEVIRGSQRRWLHDDAANTANSAILGRASSCSVKAKIGIRVTGFAKICFHPTLSQLEAALAPRSRQMRRQELDLHISRLRSRRPAKTPANVGRKRSAISTGSYDRENLIPM